MYQSKFEFLLQQILMIHFFEQIEYADFGNYSEKELNAYK